MEGLNYTKLYQAYSVRGRKSAETLFIDGTKLEACANKYMFAWKKFVNRREEKMSHKIAEAVKQLNHEYMTRFPVATEQMAEHLQGICTFLTDYCEKHQVVLVYGKGKRKSVYQRYLELFEGFLSRQLLYELHNSRFGFRNSYSKMDPDATFMKMKDDHMRNAQLKPGYNVQIGVDSEFIIGVGIYQDRNDYGTLIPFLEELEEASGYRYPSITADAGYEREENYVYLEMTKQIAYTKPQTYEKWKKEALKKDISKRENMRYLEEGDVYICHNNRLLWPVKISHRTSVSGYLR